MAILPQPLFYVYILARPNGKPFYVGKGCRNRILRHESDARKGCDCHKCRVIRKIWHDGGEVQRYTVFTTSSEEEAHAYEREMIALHGRENLCNQTDGGEGGSNPSPEIRQRQSETRKAIWAKSPDRKARQVDRMRRHYEDPKNRDRTSEHSKRYYESPENRKKSSDRMKRIWSTPGEKERRSARMLEYYEDPAKRDIPRKNIYAYYENPENREKARERNRLSNSNPETRKKISQGVANYYLTDKARKERSEAVKKSWITRRQKAKEKNNGEN